MALTQNDGLRNVLSNAWGATFNSGTLEIRTSAEAVLGTITLPASPFGASASGVISKSGTWSATASAGGVAAKGVFISSDTNKTATVSVGETGADLIIDDATIVSGGTITVSTFTYTTPAS